MTSRRLLLFACPLVACATVFALFVMLPSNGVTLASYGQIKEGMTKAEVEEVFGRKGRPIQVPVPIEPPPGYRELNYDFWTADDGSTVTITFSDDCVLAWQWQVHNETLNEKIRRILRLP